MGDQSQRAGCLLAIGFCSGLANHGQADQEIAARVLLDLAWWRDRGEALLVLCRRSKDPMQLSRSARSGSGKTGRKSPAAPAQRRSTRFTLERWDRFQRAAVAARPRPRAQG